MSNLSISQTTNTNLTKCFSPTQVDEIYKGLKQGEYLKARLQKTETTLSEADKLVSQQSSIIAKLYSLSEAKDSVIANNKEIYTQDIILKETQIKQLNNQIETNKKEASKKSKKSFWNGFKTGSVAGVVASVAAYIFLIK